MSVVVAKCPECGVDVKLPTGVTEQLRSLALRVAAQGVPCNDCTEKVERAEREQVEEQLRVRGVDVWMTEINRSKVPALPAGFQWPDDPAIGRAVLAARQWAERKSLVLCLYGPVGSGKTTLAKAAFRERLKPVIRDGRLFHRHGAWRSASALMHDSGKGSVASKDVEELMRGNVMLALDDLDKVRGTEFALERLHAVIDAAIETRSPLIVTMNADLAQLATQWGGAGSRGHAVASRLQSGAIYVPGRDRRAA